MVALGSYLALILVLDTVWPFNNLEFAFLDKSFVYAIGVAPSSKIFIA